MRRQHLEGEFIGIAVCGFLFEDFEFGAFVLVIGGAELVVFTLFEEAVLLAFLGLRALSEEKLVKVEGRIGEYALVVAALNCVAPFVRHCGDFWLCSRRPGGSVVSVRRQWHSGTSCWSGRFFGMSSKW